MRTKQRGGGGEGRGVTNDRGGIHGTSEKFAFHDDTTVMILSYFLQILAPNPTFGDRNETVLLGEEATRRFTEFFE